MSMKLYVGSLSWSTTEDALRRAFESHGSVQDVTLVTDRDTGRSRGFGFVTFADEEHARSAMATMNGTELDGRSISVSQAEERTRTPRFGSDSRGSQNNNKRNSNRGGGGRW